jgi:hypothetical protein
MDTSTDLTPTKQSNSLLQSTDNRERKKSEPERLQAFYQRIEQE